MRRVFLIFSFIVLFYSGFGFYLATFELETFKDHQVSNHPLFHDYKGVSHVVTSYTKGSLPPEAILPQALSAKLDFIFFTDINLIERPYNISGYHGDIFIFSNQKFSYVDSHILVYSQDPDFYFKSMNEANVQLNQHFSENKNSEHKKTEAPFFTILAHPFKKGHAWTGEYPEGLDGIEVINMRHIWQQVWFKNPSTFFWSLMIYPFNSHLSFLRLIQDPTDEIKLWDSLNDRRKTLGFLGNQTTSKVFRVFGMDFTFPSYLRSFQFGSNHILLKSELTGHEESDRKKIFETLKNGQFYFAFDSLGETKGFATYIKSKNKIFLMGTNVKLSKNLQLFVDLPPNINVPFSVDIYRNGSLFKRSKNISIKTTITKPGVYRVVVNIHPKFPFFVDKKRWFGWIYSNPFYIQ